MLGRLDDKAGFSIARILVLCQLCSDSYADRLPETSDRCEVRAFCEASIQFWALKFCNDPQVIVIRGTNQMTDWLRNLAALPTYYMGGFEPLGYSTAADRILAKTACFVDEKRPTVITGHS